MDEVCRKNLSSKIAMPDKYVIPIHIYLAVIVCFSLLLASCSIRQRITKDVTHTILNDSSFINAHTGICIYDPASSKYLCNYQSNKYFTPASNTKLFTCYAAMKHLGDSLAGLRYDIQNGNITILGTGDPTFLHPDFKNQPVYDFLKKQVRIAYLDDPFLRSFSPLGKGWAWDDYQEDYMAERSEFPIYGNVATFYMQGDSVTVSPPFFYNSAIHYCNQTIRSVDDLHFKIVRPFEGNNFHGLGELLNTPTFSKQSIPFKTVLDPTFSYLNNNTTFIRLLSDTLEKENFIECCSGWADSRGKLPNILHSQPTDSLLMMHRSDNFFAEQTLLMVSNEMLDYMSDDKVIDSLLKTDFKDLPQKPKWVDGSGLSRYNLFTPQDFVWLLNKMKSDFTWQRITAILPTGNEGTLSGYYKNYAGKIYAKTGSLGNIFSLSGYITTQKGKQLIFSVMINGFQSPSPVIRKKIENLLTQIMEEN